MAEIDKDSDIVEDLLYLGKLVRGAPPILSPNLEDSEITQHVRRPLRRAIGNFRVVLNVSMFQPQEVLIAYDSENELRITAAHPVRQNPDGLWISNKCEMTYVLPDDIVNRMLHVQWSKDGFLLIEAAPIQFSNRSNTGRILTPTQVDAVLKPGVEVKVLKQMFDDIILKADYALRYLRLRTCNPSSPSESQVFQLSQSTELMEHQLQVLL